jgi:hypothetical protein
MTEHLNTIWEVLHAYREDNIPEGIDNNDETWDDICYAMAIIKMHDNVVFDNEELNCINVCLDHFIEEQTQADFEIKFTELKKKELHEGIGYDQLQMYSEQLKRLAIAVKALSKINQHTPIGDN